MSAGVAAPPGGVTGARAVGSAGDLMGDAEAAASASADEKALMDARDTGPTAARRSVCSPRTARIRRAVALDELTAEVCEASLHVAGAVELFVVLFFVAPTTLLLPRTRVGIPL